MAADWNPGVTVPNLVIRSIKYILDAGTGNLNRYNSIMSLESTLARSSQNYSAVVPHVHEASGALNFRSNGVVTASRAVPTVSSLCARTDRIVKDDNGESCGARFGALPSDLTKCTWCVDMYKAGVNKPQQVAKDIFGNTQTFAPYETYLALQLCDKTFIEE